MRSEPSAPAEPTLQRKITAAVLVAAFAVGIGWFVEWRGAAPPPPAAPATQPR